MIRFDHQNVDPISPLQEKALKDAYLAIYALAGASKQDHFIFTSSGAEAINHAVFSAYLDITRKTGKNHFLCSALSEAPAIMAMSRLHELGCVFEMVPASSEGVITEKGLIEKLTPRTAMLSLSLANALTGVVQPLEGIIELCRERNILFHVDVSHVLGKGDFSFHESGIDILTFQPPLAGTGGMFIREGVEISPFILGGSNQAQMRGGAFNAALFIEFAKWARDERINTDHTCIEVARLRSLFEEMVCGKNPKVKVLYRERMRVPHITSFIFPGVSSDLLHYALQQKGIVTTMGGDLLQHFSHQLKACNMQAPDCHSALSFAFSYNTTEEEVLHGAKVLIETLSILEKYSGHLMSETYEL